MTWFWFILGSLATFRLSLLVSRESGPARIFRKLRNLPDPKSATKEGLECPLCLSVSFGAAIAAFYVWRELIKPWDWPMYWLAFSAVSVILHMQFTRPVGK